jgi:hypothetical protein
MEHSLWKAEGSEKNQPEIEEICAITSEAIGQCCPSLRFIHELIESDQLIKCYTGCGSSCTH